MSNGTSNNSLSKNFLSSDWMDQFNKDNQEFYEKIQRDSRERRLKFSLELGEQGLGGSGTVFIPSNTSVEERNKLLDGKVIGYKKEITPLDLGEDSKYDQTGTVFYYGDPSSAKITTQKGLYYVPGRGWNQGSATSVDILDDMKGGGLRGKTKDDFTVFTIFGEKPEDAYDENGEYKGFMSDGNFTFSGKTTLNINGNEYDFVPDFKNAEFENRPSTILDIETSVSDITSDRINADEEGFRREVNWASSLDMVVDPFDFGNTMKYFSMNTDFLTGGGVLGGDYPTPMSESGQIAPSGEEWWDREITILKTYKHKNEDGSFVDVYETHNDKITNQVAEVIVGPLPSKPTKEADGKWYYGGELIPEEDALEIIVLRNEQIAKRRKLYEDGWRIYYPEEKLLNSEMTTYLDSFEQMFGDDYINYVSDFANRSDLLEYAWNLWTGPIEKNRNYYGKEEYYGVNWNELTETDQDFVLKTLRYWDSKGDDLTLASFSEFADFYTGFNPYPSDEQDKKIFLTQVNKVNKIFEDTNVESNVPKKFIQMNNLLGWGEAINEFSAMITPIMVTSGYVGTTLASSSIPLQMAGQGVTWATYGGLHDYTRDEFDYNWDRFMVSRGLDFAVGSLFAPFSGQVPVPAQYRNTALGKVLQQYFVGNPLGTFSKNQLNQPTLEGAYKITQWVLPAIKFESQVQGMNVLLTSHSYAETLNRNLSASEDGLWITDPDGDLKFVDNPSISQVIAKTTQDIFGVNSGFGKHLMVQQAITHMMHGFPIFKPKKINVYVDKNGIENPFKFKNSISDLRFDPKTNKWYEYKGNKIYGEPEWSLTQKEVTLGPLALRNYYRNFMQHTNKWIKNHYELGGKQSGTTLHGDRWKPTFTIEDHKLWMDLYYKTLPFRDHTMDGIINGILNLEGKTVNGKVLTKDDVRAIASNYTEIYKRVRNNPNFLTLNELRIHELQINNYVGAGMEWNFRQYGDVFGGIRTTSMVPFLKFEPTLNQIRFQGEIPTLAEPITKIMKSNPIFKNLDIVFLPEKPYTCLTWDKIKYHDPFAVLSEYEGYKLINEKGDVANGENFGEEIGQYFDTGQDIYVIQPEGQNTVASDGTGQVIFSEGVGKEALIEDGIVEPLYKLLEKVDPELKAEIDALMKTTHQELIRLGISGEVIDITELFSKAYTYNALGYAESDPHLAEFMHLPKDIVDRFSKWVLYETGESIESIIGTQPPKEAPYTDISDILYGEPFEGNIVYQETSYHLPKNVNNKKNKLYVSKGEDILEKLNAVSLKQRGVKNFLKRHGMSDNEIADLNINELLSKYQPTESIPSEVLTNWIKENTFVLEEALLVEDKELIRQHEDDPSFHTEIRYDLEMGGERFSELNPNHDVHGMEQYRDNIFLEQVIDDDIQYRFEDQEYDIYDGSHPDFYHPDDVVENGIYAKHDMTLEFDVRNPRTHLIEKYTKEIKEGDKVFDDNNEFFDWFNDDARNSDYYEIVQEEYVDFDRPITPRVVTTESGELLQLTKYHDYKLKGGEDYKELLIINPFLEYNEGHWGDVQTLEMGDKIPSTQYNNVIGHIRFQTVWDKDGNKILFVEEIQSKIHQKGAIDGYNKRNTLPHDHNKVPDAPLKEDWAKVYINRIMQYAIDNGFEGISLIDGIKSGTRWDALTYFDKIGYQYTPIILDKLPEKVSSTIIEITPEMIIEKNVGGTDNVNKVRVDSEVWGEVRGDAHYPERVWTGKVFDDHTHLFLDENGFVKSGSYEPNVSIEEQILNSINKGRQRNDKLKEYDVTLYDSDGRQTRKLLSDSELNEFFGHRADQIRNGVGEEIDGIKYLTDVNKLDIREGRSGEFFLRFYDKDIPNTLDKILSEYDLKLENYTFKDGIRTDEINTHKTVLFNDKIISDRKDKPTPTYKIKKHKFKSGQTESLFNDAKISTKQDGPTFLENTVNYLTNFKNYFTRHYPSMPKGGKFAPANDILRRYEASGDFSNELSYYYLNDIVGDMDALTFHNFERAVILSDIYSDYQQGKPVTYFKMTEETFLEEYDAIQEIIESDPNLQKALERRRSIQKIIVDQLVELDILDADVVAQNPNYYHHQVLMYQQIFNNSGELKSPTPGYSKERIGGYDFNTNYLESEFLYMTGALKDIQTVKILNELNAEYNIMDKIKADHKAETGKIKGWEEKIPEDYVIWLPDKRNIFYSTQTITESQLNEFIENANSDFNIPSDALKELKDMMSTSLVFGGKKDGLVIPKELATTLDTEFAKYESNIYDQVFAPLRWSIKNWKKWTLFSLPRVAKYNLNNLSGDMDVAIAGNPGVVLKIPEATKILWDAVNGRDVPQVYWDCLETGVFSGTFISQEIGDVNKFKKLMDSKLKEDPNYFKKIINLPLDVATKYWETTTGLTAFRENQLRLSAYIYYYNRLSNGESLKDIGYGATDPAQLEGITDHKKIAGILARNLIGDYGNITKGGQFLRENVAPFFSFQEINFKRYTNLFLNSYKSGDYDSFKSSFWGAGKQGAYAMWRFSRIFWLYSAMNSWNNTGDRKELNEELGDIDKTRLYMITGKNEDTGKIEMIRMSGALDDYLQLWGGDEVKYYLEQYNNGTMNWDDIMKDIADNPLFVPEAMLERGFEMIGPQWKYPLEELSGLSFFPDPFDPSPTDPKDQGARLLLRQLGLEHFYDKFTGRPTKRWGNYFKGWIVNEVYVDEINYYDIKSNVRDFVYEKTGEESSYFSEKSFNMKMYKKALRFDQPELAEKYLNILKDNYDMDEKDINNSIDAMSPFYHMPNDMIAEWMEGLSILEKRQLDNSIDYYLDVYNPKNMDKELLYFEIRRKDLRARITQAQDDYKDWEEGGKVGSKPILNFTKDELKELEEIWRKLRKPDKNPRFEKIRNMWTEGRNIYARINSIGSTIK